MTEIQSEQIPNGAEPIVPRFTIDQAMSAEFQKIAEKLERERRDPMGWAFPSIDPNMEPLGNRVLVQIRRPKQETAGGIAKAAETKDIERWNTSVARVVAVGPMAFRSLDTGELWREGAWVKVGDHVHVPLHNGLRVMIPIPGEDPVMLVMFRDYEMIARIPGDPLSVIAYV